METTVFVPSPDSVKPPRSSVRDLLILIFSVTSRSRTIGSLPSAAAIASAIVGYLFSPIFAAFSGVSGFVGVSGSVGFSDSAGVFDVDVLSPAVVFSSAGFTSLEDWSSVLGASELVSLGD